MSQKIPELQKLFLLRNRFFFNHSNQPTRFALLFRCTACSAYCGHGHRFQSTISGVECNFCSLIWLGSSTNRAAQNEASAHKEKSKDRGLLRFQDAGALLWFLGPDIPRSLRFHLLPVNADGCFYRSQIRWNLDGQAPDSAHFEK